MKKYIVLGVNENPVYLYYLPLIKWAWAQFGWDVFVFYVGKVEGPIYNRIAMAYYGITEDKGVIDIWHDIILGTYNGYKSETVAQVSRLHAAAVSGPWQGIEGHFLMTSDVDMLPLSDYWKPKPGEFTCYGRDLTDYHFPICYLAASYYDWQDVMILRNMDYSESIKRDLRKQKNMWCLDQDIITERLFVYQDIITRIDRGIDKRTGYPLGRVDRSNWRLDHSQLIDAHLPHDILTNDESFRKVMQLLHLVWPSTDFKWWINYTKEFKKLL